MPWASLPLSGPQAHASPLSLQAPFLQPATPGNIPTSLLISLSLPSPNLDADEDQAIEVELASWTRGYTVDLLSLLIQIQQKTGKARKAILVKAFGGEPARATLGRQLSTLVHSTQQEREKFMSFGRTEEGLWSHFRNAMNERLNQEKANQVIWQGLLPQPQPQPDQ
ncbi:hypothetical protein BOTBODRAFT_49578 [Botryobasidium botryosum FD-172 SS1]|uniref:Uncharacterized protein n=1 Tax=Botryobasidium botryosum (strain FD-172 SS1) TaxID=930990 RepID=A0A067LS34_BOTB1|nr:hypothetical protein BOTBODRAFT_49578 [Botryobasidium botryosum FD-172 SS1]